LIVCLFHCFIRHVHVRVCLTAPLLHEAEKLRDFLDYLNYRQNNIQFTIGTATVGHLPFLDINICSKEDGSLGDKSTQETARQKPLPECKITPPSKKHTPHPKDQHLYQIALKPIRTRVKNCTCVFACLGTDHTNM
jgi:hypothetical protein